MKNVRIDYREYDGYVGYKVFPPGESKKVSLLGVGKDHKDCLLQVERAIALINEAKADAQTPAIIDAEVSPPPRPFLKLQPD